jgi:hypothetical protein
VSFQVPPDIIYAAFSFLLGMKPDPNVCQIATTVTRADALKYGSLGADQGQAGATVTIHPPLPPRHGPIYFRFLPENLGVIYPDRSLAETSRDGGVLFVDVPTGEYTLRAQKPSVEFTSIKVKCRPGVLVNASPPHCLQAKAK